MKYERHQIYQYIFKHKRGKCFDFIQMFGKNIFDELISLGYISISSLLKYESDCEWEITKNGKKFISIYLKLIKNKKCSKYSIVDIMKKIIF